MILQDFIKKNIDIWERYLYHDFIKYLANSKLKEESFKHYLIQDYIFLKNIGKIYALAIYKSQDVEDLNFFSSNLQTLLQKEIEHHVEYCQKQNIKKEELENAEEEISTIAYTRYLLDIANSYSVEEIAISLAPCIIGYYDFAKKIGNEIPFNPKNEAYKNWIDIYKDETYVNIAKEYETFINTKLADIKDDSELGKRLLKIFRTSTMCEVGFFEQSYGKFHSQGLCLIRKLFG